MHVRTPDFCNLLALGGHFIGETSPIQWWLHLVEDWLPAQQEWSRGTCTTDGVSLLIVEAVHCTVTQWHSPEWSNEQPCVFQWLWSASEGLCPRPENVLLLIHEVFEALISEFFQGVKYEYQIPCTDCLRMVGWLSETDSPGPYTLSRSLRSVWKKKAMHCSHPGQSSFDFHYRRLATQPCFHPRFLRRAIETKALFLQCHTFFHTLSMRDIQSELTLCSLHHKDLLHPCTVACVESQSASWVYVSFTTVCIPLWRCDATTVRLRLLLAVAKYSTGAGGAAWWSQYRYLRNVLWERCTSRGRHWAGVHPRRLAQDLEKQGFRW